MHSEPQSHPAHWVKDLEEKNYNVACPGPRNPEVVAEERETPERPRWETAPLRMSSESKPTKQVRKEQPGTRITLQWQQGAGRSGEEGR